MLNGIDMAFKKWWSSLLYDHTVNVRFPYSQHGLCSWTSNSAKVEAKEAFLQFVDDISQPNGRRMDSQSPTHYLLPQFKTISTPKNTLASKWIKPWCWLWAMKWWSEWIIEQRHCLNTLFQGQLHVGFLDQKQQIRISKRTCLLLST